MAKRSGELEADESVRKKQKKEKKEKKDKKDKKSKERSEKNEKKLKSEKKETSSSPESETPKCEENLIDTESKYDIIKDLAPKEFSLSDFENVEHAIGVIQTQLQRIIDIAPTQQQLSSYLERIVEMQLNTLDTLGKNLSGQILLLARSNKLQLGASLKTLYNEGKLPIFEQIINYDENTKLEGAADVKLVMDKLASSKVKVQNRGVHHDLPPLPEIRDPSIEARVFVHKSYTNGNESMTSKEKINTNNERLEFIGDAVLELIATDMVVERYPDLSEGELSRIRIAIVRNETLEKFARAYGFHKRAELIYKGVEGKEGYAESINVADSDKKYTKLIADLMEAYIGGIYMDRGIEGYAEIKEWIVELYQSFLDKHDRRLGYGIYAGKSKLPAKNHHSFSDEGTKPMTLNLLASAFPSVKSNTPHCDISQRLNLQAKSELYALVGCAIRYPTYEKLLPLPQSIIKGVPKGATFTITACYMDGEVVGTGEGISFKEASCRAAMATLENRKAVEKFHMLRLLVPKSESRVKPTEKDSKPETKTPEPVQTTTIGAPEVSSASSAKKLPAFDFPVVVDQDKEASKNARVKLQSLLLKKKYIPEFVTTSVQGGEGSNNMPVFKTTLKIRGKAICECLDMSKKQGGNRVASWFMDLVETYGEDEALKVLQ